MLESSIESFILSIFNFITDKPEVRGLLVKKHSNNLRNQGEFSFTNSLKPWCDLLNIHFNDLKNRQLTLLEYLKKDKEEIIEYSKQWNLKVKQAVENQNRVILCLDRPYSISVALTEALKNELIISRLTKNTCIVTVDPQNETEKSITSLRVKYVAKVVENLCPYVKNGVQIKEMIVTTRTERCDNAVVVGPVLNVNTNLKEVVINDDEFIRLRQTEMTLIAQHKYGARVSSDPYWSDFICNLGESAVAYELLQIKPSSVVKIDFNNGAAGCSRGASFILYNCARLETIIRTFTDKVKEGVYPPLPELDNVDFTLLKQENEWELIFNYILGFPSMLNNSVEINGNNIEFKPNHICQFLNGMARLISQYYRRTRILLEPRSHLLPLIFARMHMLQILNRILKNCLKILNIKSVTKM